MLAGPQDNPIDRILVQLQQARGGSHANALGRMVDDLTNSIWHQMQTKQGAGLGGGKTLAAGAAVKQIAGIIFTVLAANGDVALTAKAVILALFVGTKTLLKVAH